MNLGFPLRLEKYSLKALSAYIKACFTALLGTSFIQVGVLGSLLTLFEYSKAEIKSLSEAKFSKFSDTNWL